MGGVFSCGETAWSALWWGMYSTVAVKAAHSGSCGLKRWSFRAAPGICFTSVFSDAEDGKAVASRLFAPLFQIQSRRESDAEQRQKYRRSPSSADTCKPVFSMSLDICAIRNALRFSPLRRLPHIIFTKRRHRSAVPWTCRYRPGACSSR